VEPMEAAGVEPMEATSSPAFMMLDLPDMSDLPEVILPDVPFISEPENADPPVYEVDDDFCNNMNPDA